MKKSVALVLAVVLVLAMSVSSFALDQTNQTGSTTVTYTQNQTYTWSVPSSLAAGDATGASVTASGIIAPDYQLEITCPDTVTLKIGTNTATAVSAAVTYETLTISAGTTSAVSKTVKVAAPTDVKYAGDYTGTLTFTAAVSAVSASPAPVEPAPVEP